jgi:hypothetical protein
MVVGAVLILGLAGGACRSRASSAGEPVKTTSPEDDCRGDACVNLRGRLLGDRPSVVLGAEVDVTSFEAEMVQVGWHLGSGTYFQATLGPGPFVFPLAEGLAKFSYCRGVLTVGNHSLPPAAGILLRPDSPLPKLAPGDAFIPLGGEATLDGDLYASARVEQSAPTDGGPLSVSIGIKPTRREGTAFHAMHAGDTFPWGENQATLLRIVVSANVVAGIIQDGWVEVALSARKAGSK